MNRVRPLLALLVLPVLALGLVACGSDSDDAGSPVPDGDVPAAGTDAATAALDEGRVVIDVRTPEEFDEGHIEGALRIGLADDDFADQIQALDPEGRYVVYCRTGNRSAEAAAQMREAGLDVYDGGGYDDMREAGWPPAATDEEPPVPSSVS